MKWRDYTYKGRTYELGHLHPFTCHFAFDQDGKHPARKFNFNIEFSMHCFTKQSIAGTDLVDDEALFYQGPKESRLFCFERYELSRQLPEIIRTLDQRICWHTHHGNFFTIEMQGEDGRSAEYEVYFDVYKSAKGWLTLIVQSAYVRDAQHNTTQPKKRKIRFSVIARNRLTNKKLRPPG